MACISCGVITSAWLCRICSLCERAMRACGVRTYDAADQRIGPILASTLIVYLCLCRQPIWARLKIRHSILSYLILHGGPVVVARICLLFEHRLPSHRGDGFDSRRVIQ